MRKWTAVVLAVLWSATILAGCAGSDAYQDGTYTASFKDFDSRNYKDTLTLTVEDGIVTEAVYDAVDPDGNLKSQDEEYREEMGPVQDTYPEKVFADLTNQYLEMQDSAKVDIVAGATYSSDAFLALVKALEPAMEEGNTEPVLVDNIQEK